MGQGWRKGKQTERKVSANKVKLAVVETFPKIHARVIPNTAVSGFFSGTPASQPYCTAVRTCSSFRLALRNFCVYVPLLIIHVADLGARVSLPPYGPLERVP